jgi:hypothetical protein
MDDAGNPALSAAANIIVRAGGPKWTARRVSRLAEQRAVGEGERDG